MNRPILAFVLCLAGILAGCASTNLIESPKTVLVPDSEETGVPAIIWTSRTLDKEYDYLGIVKTRSWTYGGGLERLVDGGKELKADAIVDIHYRKVGFLSTFQAFAIKFK